MALTDAQLPILRTAIEAETDPAFKDAKQNGRTGEMASFYNVLITGYWAWRSNVRKEQVYFATSSDNTTFDFAVHKNQGVPELMTWDDLFVQGGQANFGLLNVRNAANAIYSQSAAQRNHIAAIAKREAKRGEKLYVTGVGSDLGSKANPATLGYEGDINNSDVVRALDIKPWPQ